MYICKMMSVLHGRICELVSSNVKLGSCEATRTLSEGRTRIGLLTGCSC